MVFIGHHSGLAWQREQSAFPDLLWVLWLPGFLRWTPQAAGREEPVCRRDHWPALMKYLRSSRIFSSAGRFWKLSPAAYWIFLKIAPPGRGLLTSLTAGKPQPKA